MKGLRFALALSVLAFGLPSVGCGLGGDGSLGEDATLEGTIQGWNRGTDHSVRASVVGEGGSGEVTTSAPIDVMGAFRVPLPKGAALAPLLRSFRSSLPSECLHSPEVDPADVKLAVLSLIVSGPSIAATPLSIDSRFGGADPSNGVVEAAFWYVDRDARISGRDQCFSSYPPNDYALSLRKGWNSLVLKISPDGSSTQFHSETATGPLPSELQWRTSY